MLLSMRANIEGSRALVGWVAVISCFSWFCAVITHNTIHCPIFKKKSWNKALSKKSGECSP